MQTVFENCRQILNKILFLSYIQTPPPSLEIRSHRITVKSGRWISLSFMPSNKKVSQIHISRVEEVHKSCNNLTFGFDFVNNLAIFNSIKLYIRGWAWFTGFSWPSPVANMAMLDSWFEAICFGLAAYLTWAVLLLSFDLKKDMWLNESWGYPGE